jgi:hypothetical protein
MRPVNRSRSATILRDNRESVGGEPARLLDPNRQARDTEVALAMGNPGCCVDVVYETVWIADLCAGRFSAMADIATYYCIII